MPFMLWHLLCDSIVLNIILDPHFNRWKRPVVHIAFFDRVPVAFSNCFQNITVNPGCYRQIGGLTVCKKKSSPFLLMVWEFVFKNEN